MGRTSLISFILQPPLPMSEPHWLAGTTRRMVTGGLLVAVLLVIEVLMSWWETLNKRANQRVTCAAMTRPIKDAARPELTSSSFSMIMEKALKMEVVGPARVMILSGQFPSEMLMRAPLCRDGPGKQTGRTRWATTLQFNRHSPPSGIKDRIPLNISSGEPTSSLIFLTDSPFCKKAQPQTKSINKPQYKMQ